MTDIPLHTLRVVHGQLGAYCRRVCPPTARTTVILGFRLESARVILHEVRSFCGVPGAARYVDIAQFRYDARRAGWRLYHPDDRDQWRRYPPTRDEPRFIALLRALDADAMGLFWGSVDGKSLRWCSAAGRCMGCDAEYGRILGLASHPHSAADTQLSYAGDVRRL